MFDEIIVIGEVAAKQTEEYDKHLGYSPANIYKYE